jgi:hypothetical protein
VAGSGRLHELTRVKGRACMIWHLLGVNLGTCMHGGVDLGACIHAGVNEAHAFSLFLYFVIS